MLFAANLVKSALKQHSLSNIAYSQRLMNSERVSDLSNCGRNALDACMHKHEMHVHGLLPPPPNAPADVRIKHYTRKHELCTDMIWQ